MSRNADTYTLLVRLAESNQNYFWSDFLFIRGTRSLLESWKGTSTTAVFHYIVLYQIPMSLDCSQKLYFYFCTNFLFIRGIVVLSWNLWKDHLQQRPFPKSLLYPCQRVPVVPFFGGLVVCTVSELGLYVWLNLLLDILANLATPRKHYSKNMFWVEGFFFISDHFECALTLFVLLTKWLCFITNYNSKKVNWATKNGSM